VPQPSFSRTSFTRIIESLPATVPFVAPEALERRTGRPIRLRLGANESAFGASARAQQAMITSASRIGWYADPEGFELRREIATQKGVGTENVVLGSGIDDLLGTIVRIFLEPGTAAVTSLGAYPTFNYHVAGYGGALHTVAYKDDRNDLPALAAAVREKNARILFLANPDNPTGSWYKAEQLRNWLAELPDGCVLILDEAYLDFAPPAEVLPADVADARLIRVRTFSKAHGLAGARIGYAIGCAETIAAFEKVRLHFGVNRFAQAGALESLRDTEFLQSVIAAVEAGRQDYHRLGQELGLATLPSFGNFVTFDLGSAAAAKALVNSLLERGVFVRSPQASPLDRLVRVTVGTPAERVQFGAIMHELAREGRAAGTN
jgi:histidinol-phosphate aminotransferase